MAFSILLYESEENYLCRFQQITAPYGLRKRDAISSRAGPRMDSTSRLFLEANGQLQHVYCAVGLVILCCNFKLWIFFERNKNDTDSPGSLEYLFRILLRVFCVHGRQPEAGQSKTLPESSFFIFVCSVLRPDFLDQNFAGWLDRSAARSHLRSLHDSRTQGISEILLFLFFVLSN